MIVWIVVGTVTTVKVEEGTSDFPSETPGWVGVPSFFVSLPT